VPYFEVGNTEIHFHEQGRKGVPLLCVHPPCLSSRLFTYVRTELSDDRRVITLDVRGHGHSKPGSAKLTLPMIAEDMRQLLDFCDVKKAYVCTYGSASLPAIAALLAYPDRFCGGILISGTAGYTDFVSRAGLQAAYVTSAVKAKPLVALGGAWKEADNRTAFDAMRAEAMQADAAKWKEYAAACLNASFKRQLGQVRQPMLVIYGTNDRTGSRYAKQLYRDLPNCELYGVRNAERELLMKEPARTAFVIRQWTDKLDRPETADTLEERDATLREIADREVTIGLEEELPAGPL